MRIRKNPAENASQTSIWKWCIDRNSIGFQNCRNGASISDRSRVADRPNSCFSSATTPSSSSSISSSSVESSSGIDSETRCHGLDLLAEAVLHVVENVFESSCEETSSVTIMGVSVFGVPFTQRKVIRRAKRAFRFMKNGENGIDQEHKKEIEKERAIGFGLRSKRSRSQAIPSKFQDSVLQSWKRGTRRRLIDGSHLDAE